MSSFCLLTFNVAGLAHYVKIEELKDVAVGEHIAMVREPTNEFDSNAIRLDIGWDTKTWKKIGYVPRGYAAVLAPLMDNGYSEKMRAHVTEIIPKRGAVEIAVKMEKA